MSSFRQSVRRSKHRFLSAVGKASLSKDEEHETIYHRIQATEQAEIRPQNHIKELMSEINTFENNMTEMNEGSQRLSKKYENEFGSTENNVDSTLLEECTNNINNHLKDIPKMREKEKQRQKLLLDLDIHTRQVSSLEEKPPKDDVTLTKAREQLEKVKQEYEELQEKQREDMEESLRQAALLYDNVAASMLTMTTNFVSSTRQRFE